MPTIKFKSHDREVEVPEGTLISDAARMVGIEVNMPCGGQGRCGRCAVVVEEGEVQRRSVARLSPEALSEGYALACQATVQSDLVVTIPPQEKIERRLPSSQRVAEVGVPPSYDPSTDQTLRKYFVQIEPPSLSDNTDDLARLKRELQAQLEVDLPQLKIELPVLRKLATVLREAQWKVTLVVETETWVSPDGPPRLVDIEPGDSTSSLWGVAVDIGTTSNVVYLVDLLTGRVVDSASDYNHQIARGEDIISRIIFASKPEGLGELQGLVLETINGLLRGLVERNGISTEAPSRTRGAFTSRNVSSMKPSFPHLLLRTYHFSS